MYLLNIYIIKNFLSKFLFLLICFVSLFLVIDIIDNINDFLESDIPRKEMLHYFILSIPGFISIALPMTTLLACIFTIGQLQKNHELTAIKASGISLKKISINLIIMGFIISGLSFVFDNTLVSNSFKKRSAIDSKFLKPTNKNQKINNFHIIYEYIKNQNMLDKSTSILYLNSYDLIKAETKNATIQKIRKEGYMESELKIGTLGYSKKLDSWIRKDMQLREKENGMISTKIPNDTVQFYIPNAYGEHTFDKNKFSSFKDENLNAIYPEPEEMSYWEIKRQSSLDPTNITLKVNYNFKVAFSFTSVIMVLFGIGLSIRRPKTNYATGIGLGIIVIFLYYLGIKFGQSLGYNEVLSPPFSVWLVNLLFLGIGTRLFLKIRT